MLDDSEIYIKELSHTIINIYKLCVEDMGYDMGDTNNDIEYRNYLVDQPIEFGMGGMFGSSTDLDHNIAQSNFVDYSGPPDGSIGSNAFPQGKGKGLDPNGQYFPFYTFGFGASPRKRPDKAYSQRSGVDCCKLAVETILGYVSKGCRTIGDVICMYHTGTKTYEDFLRYYNSIPGINDIADGRFVSSAEMISRQNTYQQHLVDYVHMSNRTPISRSYQVLFPLITFISRQEQGVNCEAACKIALEQMNIT